MYRHQPGRCRASEGDDLRRVIFLTLLSGCAICGWSLGEQEFDLKKLDLSQARASIAGSQSIYVTSILYEGQLLSAVLEYDGRTGARVVDVSPKKRLDLRDTIDLTFAELVVRGDDIIELGRIVISEKAYSGLLRHQGGGHFTLNSKDLWEVSLPDAFGFKIGDVALEIANERLSASNQELTDRLQELQAAKEELEALSQTLKSRQTTLLAQLDASSDENAELKARVQTLLTASTELTNSLKTLAERAVELEASNAALDRSAAQLEQERSKLTSLLASADSENRGLSESLRRLEQESVTTRGELERKNETFSTQLAELQVDKRKLADQLAESQDEARQLSVRLTGLEGDKTAQIEELTRLKDELQRQRGELELARDTLAAANSRLATEGETARVENAALTRRLDELISDNESLKSRLETQAADDTELTRRIEALRVENQALASDYDTLDLENVQLSGEIGTIRAQLQTLASQQTQSKDRIATLERERQALVREQKGLVSEKDKLSGRAQELGAENDMLLARVATIEADYARQQERGVSLEEEKTRLTGRLQMLEAERSELSELLVATRSELSGWVEENLRLDLVKNLLTHELEEARAQEKVGSEPARLPMSLDLRYSSLRAADEGAIEVMNVVVEGRAFTGILRLRKDGTFSIQEYAQVAFPQAPKLPRPLELRFASLEIRQDDSILASDVVVGGQAYAGVLRQRHDGSFSLERYWRTPLPTVTKQDLAQRVVLLESENDGLRTRLSDTSWKLTSLLEEGFLEPEDVLFSGVQGGSSLLGQWELREDVLVQTDTSLYFAKYRIPLEQNQSEILYEFSTKALRDTWLGCGLHIFAGSEKTGNGYGYGKSFLIWITSDAKYYRTHDTFLQIYQSFDDINMLQLKSVRIPESIYDSVKVRIYHSRLENKFIVSVDGKKRLEYLLETAVASGDKVAFRSLGGPVEFSDFVVRVND